MGALSGGSRCARALSCIAATLAILARAAPAGAVVLSEDPLAGDSVELGGTVRTFNYVMFGGPLTGPLVPPDSNPAAASIEALRPSFQWKKGDSFTLTLHDELTSSVTSLPASALGGPLALGQGRTAPVWLPLQSTLADSPQVSILNRVDWMYARYRASAWTFTLGRQPITLGRAVLWTPVDLLAPFSPLQINTDFKPGVDAARVAYAPSGSLTLEMIGVAGRLADDGGFAIRGDGSAAMLRVAPTFGTTRLGFMAGYVRQDGVAGVDAFVDVGHGADVHAEATATYVPDEDRRLFGQSVFARAVLGSTFRIAAKLNATVEAYYNGSGAEKRRDYLSEFASTRFQIGEVYNVGRYYAGGSLLWEPYPLLHIGLTALVNVGDPSVLAAPIVRYDLASNVQLVAGAFVPVGAPLRYDASSTPHAGSEFGLYPDLYHVDAKLYF